MRKYKEFVLGPIILITFIALISLYFIVFNGELSTNTDDWQAFGSYASAIFSLVAIILTYIIFHRQTDIETQNNYNNFCMNFITCHQNLYDRIGSETFLKMSNHIERMIGDFKYEKPLRPEKVKDIYENYLKHTYKSMNIRNYFKFIHYEIDYIYRNFSDEASKENGIEMIRSYMSNQELFCYFINQIQYCKDGNKAEIKEYGAILKKYKFFDEMLIYSVYNDIAMTIDKDIVFLFTDKYH